MWAAKGLAYTCWVSYADSATGLGPDGLMMEWDGDGDEDGSGGGGERWVEALRRWEDGGRKGDVPGLGLGVAGVGAGAGRDYTGNAGYYLRPEVRVSVL